MAATPTVVKRAEFEGQAAIVDILLDNSYPTGGYALTDGKALGLRVGKVDQVQAQSAGGYVFEWDEANEKLKAYYADYDAVADGALIEVANAVDLSAVTTRAAVHGR